MLRRLYLPGTYHPLPRNLPPPTSAQDLSAPAQNLPPPVQLQMPSQLKRFPYRFHKPPFKYEASLIPLALSLVIRPTVAPPCLKRGNLPPLRSSLLFCLGPELYLTFLVHYIQRGWGTRLSFSFTPSPSLSLFSLFLESGSSNPNIRTSAELTFLPGLLSSPRNRTPSAFVNGASLVLRLYWCFAYSQASALPPFPLSLTTSGPGNSCHSTALHATLHSSRAPRLRWDLDGVLEVP